jgi:hypothetical protein
VLPGPAEVAVPGPPEIAVWYRARIAEKNLGEYETFGVSPPFS